MVHQQGLKLGILGIKQVSTISMVTEHQLGQHQHLL